MKNYPYAVSMRTILVASLLMFTVASCEADSGSSVNPQQVLDEFYSYDGAEDTLMDPLIVGGKDVVPSILQAIQMTEMPKRRYAIAALGNIGDPRAIPVLEMLSETVTEPGYIRCVSTQAIAQIDWDAGQTLAARFIDAQERAEELPECLPRVSKQILEYSQEEWLKKTGIVRSLEDALKRRHY